MSILNYIYFSIKKNLGRFSLVIPTSVMMLFCLASPSSSKAEAVIIQEAAKKKKMRRKKKREKKKEVEAAKTRRTRTESGLCTSRIPVSNDDCILSLILSLQAEEAGLMRKPTINQSLSGDFGMVISSH